MVPMSEILNGLVSPAYAWYWNLTGDAASLSRGDELFQHTLDDPANSIWTGKQFSQAYKWTFDYIRWRSGNATSSIVKANNPFSGPYPDTEPPIESNVAVKSITNNAATITWKTYENANSQIIYGAASGYYPLQSPALDGGLGTMSHTVTLTGLKAGTTYHYRVNSRDGAGNLASLADATFSTTGAAGNPSNVGTAGTVKTGNTTTSVTSTSSPVVGATTLR
jgi:hypothetical protein